MEIEDKYEPGENPQAASYLHVKRPGWLRLSFDQNRNFVGQIFEQKIAFLASVVFNRKTFNDTQLSIPPDTSKDDIQR